MMTDPLLAIPARAGLALLFCAAGFGKFRDQEGFRAALAGYLPSLADRPGWVLDAIRLTAAGVELAAGLFLLLAAVFPSWARMAALGGVLAAALLVAYAGLIAHALAAGRRDFACGCGGFGQRRQKVGWGLVARNFLLAAAAVAAALPVSARPLGAFDLANMVLATVTLALLYMAAEVAFALPRLERVRRIGR